MNRFDEYIRRLALSENIVPPESFDGVLTGVYRTLPETAAAGEAGKRQTKRMGVMLLAAVLLLGLSATALAYGGAGAWFAALFSERSDEPLTPAQITSSTRSRRRWVKVWLSPAIP